MEGSPLSLKPEQLRTHLYRVVIVPWRPFTTDVALRVGRFSERQNTIDILNHKSYKQSTESIHCSTSNLKTEQVNIYSKSDADKNREQLNKMMY